MNPIVFALRRPITVMTLLAAVLVGSVLAWNRMRVDIFPSLNLPVIYVCQPYGGMDPAQMEGLLTNYYEYHFLYINGIHHVESRNIQGASLMKLYFHPGTNMAQAMAETITQVNRSKAFMPYGTVPPFVMRFDTGSVPVGYLVFSSETRSIGEIQDLALFRVRPMFAALPGVSAPPPFGGTQRTMVINVDPDRLRAYGIPPAELIKSLTMSTTVSPSGNIRIGEQMPIVPTNAMVKRPEELLGTPLRPGENIYLRDVASVEDGSDVPLGYALVNGRRMVYLVVTKRADASTTAVIDEVKENLPRMQAAVPEDIKVSLEFDQSPYVTNAVHNVGMEALLGALLTGLMVLLFLRDWRSVIVVVLNIPLALLCAIFGLWLCGQTINLMTLGGLALAVGILVDEATVEVENIHTQMGKTRSIARAVRLGNADTAVPRLLAMLCVLAVFLSAFFMQGAAQALFVPLALAVGFAMISSYVLSSTFVPVLSVWLLRHHESEVSEGEASHSHFDRFRASYTAILSTLMGARWLLAPTYLVLAGLALWALAAELGREVFPQVDAGQFQVRLKAPVGTRLERTETIARYLLDAIAMEAGPSNVDISLGYVGLIPSSYPINNIFLFMSGPEEAVLRVALKKDSGVAVAELKERLRQSFPVALAKRLTNEGMPPDQAEAMARNTKLSFEPADIVNEVMSFGSPTPIEVVVSGPNLKENRAFAEKIREQLVKIATLRDLQYVQPFDYPTVEVQIDRERAGLSGVTVKEVADSVVASTSSSRFVVPVFWADPAKGIGYQVQVQIPVERMNSAKEIGMIPIRGKGGNPLLVRDVAQVREGTMPGEYDRYNMRRLVSLTANVEGEDLGRVAARINQAIAAAGAPPRGVEVDVRGQAAAMRDIFGGLGGGPVFSGLTAGLLMSIVVIFLLLTAYFQSPRLALIVLLTVPAVVAGSGLALLAVGGTLNIQSFMGAIMAIGVAVANAILLVTFAESARVAGQPAHEAAVDGAGHRLRPILMTSCAMIAGMTPLALGLGEGGDQVAPLGQAVIGGLLAATLSTLFVLPACFALLQARAATASDSLDPDDPVSPHFESGS